MPLRKQPSVDTTAVAEMQDRVQRSKKGVGIPPEALQQVVQMLGKNANDPSKPYCTCRSAGGYVFDTQMGVYVHMDCRKPSKGYYDAAVWAGVILEAP